MARGTKKIYVLQNKCKSIWNKILQLPNDSYHKILHCYRLLVFECFLKSFSIRGRTKNHTPIKNNCRSIWNQNSKLPSNSCQICFSLLQFCCLQVFLPIIFCSRANEKSYFIQAQMQIDPKLKFTLGNWFVSKHYPLVWYDCLQLFFQVIFRSRADEKSYANQKQMQIDLKPKFATGTWFGSKNSPLVRVCSRLLQYLLRFRRSTRKFRFAANAKKHIC